ncbi:MAG: D-alanine--D-alanine ligase family protein [Alphaproteobacteria bacterium]
MRIGVTFDRREDYLAQGMNPEDAAEFDPEVTIAAVCDALAALGHKPVRVGNIKALSQALAHGGRWDAVFNICEGLKGYAREAQAPALLDAYGIPYVFSDPLTLAVALDKSWAKRIVRDHGIPTPDFAVIERKADIENVNLPFPLFLKPVAEGSGKGVGKKSRVTSARQLKSVAQELLERFDEPVLAEAFLPGREFTVGITGTGDGAKVLGSTEIVPEANYCGAGYGYVNKTDWIGRVQIVEGKGPEADTACDVALAAWRALRCRDGGRVDIRCDAEGKPHFLEVNPLAGITPDWSDLCFIAKYRGVTYQELIGLFIESFLKRHPELVRRRAAA